ncbi:MAG: TlpA family protein disulfide reductase [Chitinophagaceae bacterium]|nr:TlpA family protein disulfide reductase [Chitinophagaceae bacterium]
MRYLLVFAILLSGFSAVCQNTGYDDILLKEDYAKIQRSLYNIANSNLSYGSKQIEAFIELKGFIKKYPAAENNLYLLNAAVNLTLSQIDSLIAITDTSLKRSAYMASVETARKRISLTETGKPFPPYSFIDSTGKIVSVESFRGKIILIDLWSSWCAPCRQQIPGLRKLYKKYKEKDFEIIGLSMDHDKAAWLNAIATDKQVWAHFCELVSFRNNKSRIYFSIAGIPSNFLIDKNGILIGQDLSPDQVKTILSKL